MTKEQKQVAEWMESFGQEVLRIPTVPCKAVRRLRAELILEEALEKIRALGFNPFALDSNAAIEIRVDSVNFNDKPDGCS